MFRPRLRRFQDIPPRFSMVSLETSDLFLLFVFFLLDFFLDIGVVLLLVVYVSPGCLPHASALTLPVLNPVLSLLLVTTVTRGVGFSEPSPCYLMNPLLKDSNFVAY